VTNTDAFADSVEKTWRGRRWGWRYHKPFESEGTDKSNGIRGFRVDCDLFHLP